MFDGEPPAHPESFDTKQERLCDALRDHVASGHAGYLPRILIGAIDLPGGLALVEVESVGVDGWNVYIGDEERANVDTLAEAAALVERRMTEAHG